MVLNMNFITTFTFAQLMFFIYSHKTRDVRFDLNNGGFDIVYFKMKDSCYIASYNLGGDIEDLVVYKDSLSIEN